MRNLAFSAPVLILIATMTASSQTQSINQLSANAAATPKKPQGEVSNSHPNSAARSKNPPAPSTQIYRVGMRDVLDIQITNAPGRDSTLFTVMEGGLLDYPFAGAPIVVTGLTTYEIASVLRQRIKVLDNPQVSVTVRDFASHFVTVSGFVVSPGKKALRREAMPLYAVLAEAIVQPEAARATINRRGLLPILIDIKDGNLSSTLVLPGDVIKVFGPAVASTDFFYVGGRINSPGQKSFYLGLTLTQAILASGGTSSNAGSRVKVSRLGADGKLTSEVHNLRNIQNGKVPDPILQKGDRIEVMTN